MAYQQLCQEAKTSNDNNNCKSECADSKCENADSSCACACEIQTTTTSAPICVVCTKVCPVGCSSICTDNCCFVCSNNCYSTYCQRVVEITANNPDSRNLHEANYQYYPTANHNNTPTNLHAETAAAPPNMMVQNLHVESPSHSQSQSLPPQHQPQPIFLSPETAPVTVQVQDSIKQAAIDIDVKAKGQASATVPPKPELQDDFRTLTGVINTATDTTFISQPRVENCATPVNNRACLGWQSLIQGQNSPTTTQIVTDTAGNCWVLGHGQPQPEGVAADSNQICITNADYTQPECVAAFFQTFVTKFNKSGCMKWMLGFQGADSAQMSIAVTPAGDLIVVGSYNQPHFYAFDATGKLAASLDLIGETSSFILKYDTKGCMTWSAIVCGTDIVANAYVALDSDNAIIVTGSYQGPEIVAYHADESFGTKFPAVTDSTAFVLKYSAAGHVLWMTTITNCQPRAIAAFRQDLVLALTPISSDAQIVFSNASLSGPTPNSLNVPLMLPATIITKYNGQGQGVWVTQITETSVSTQIGLTFKNHITVTSCYILAPIIYSAPNATQESGIVLPTDPDGGWAALIVNYDAEGQAVWASHITGLTTDTATNLAVDSQGDLAMVGYYAAHNLQIYNSDGSSGPMLAAAKADSSNVYLARLSAQGMVRYALKMTNLEKTQLGVALDVTRSPRLTASALTDNVIGIYNSAGKLERDIAATQTFNLVVVAYAEYLQTIILPQGSAPTKNLVMNHYNNTNTLITVPDDIVISKSRTNAKTHIFIAMLMTQPNSRITLNWCGDKWIYVASRNTYMIY